MLKKLLLAAFLALASPVPSRSDCTCPVPPPASAKEAFQRSTVVFVGRVEHVMKSPLKEGYNLVRFALLRRFKGLEEIPANYAVVLTKIEPSECGYVFLTGQDYIIYGSGTPAAFKTDSCSRTGILDNLLQDVDEISKFSAPKAPPPSLGLQNLQ